MSREPDSAQATPEETSSQWTGGQYSLVRFGLGLALFWLFGEAWWHTLGAIAPYSAGMLAASLALALTLCITLGWRDVLSGTLLLLTWAYMVLVEGWLNSTLDASLALFLVLHLLVSSFQAAPYGALSMRGRVDPGAAWRMRPWIQDMCWLLMGLVQVLFFAWLVVAEAVPGSVFQAWDVWASLALGLSCLACVFWQRRWRSQLWCFLGVVLVMGSLYQFIDEDAASMHSAGPWVLLLFLFEPRWVPVRRSSARELLFYDGECGLCHRFTRFLLAEDPGGRAFGLAPLQGASFASHTKAEQRAELPDSIILLRADGTLLTQSSAVVHMLKALGGSWRVLGTLIALLPRGLRDLVYRGIARIRKRLFAKPAGLCPLLPAHLASRFLP